MDKLMLGNMSGMEQVGYYENSEKIVNLLVSFSGAVGNVMLPRISNMVANGERKHAIKYLDVTMEIALLVSVGMAYGLTSIADIFVVLFFGKDFRACSGILSILSFSIIPSTCANVIRTQYLLPYNRDKQLSVALIFGAIINVIANLMLLPQFGGIGAAIGTLLAEFAVCIVQFFFMTKEITIMIYIRLLVSYFLKGTVMYYILFFVPFICNEVLTLLTKVTIGFCVYGAIVIFMYISKTKKKYVKYEGDNLQ